MAPIALTAAEFPRFRSSGPSFSELSFVSPRETKRPFRAADGERCKPLLACMSLVSRRYSCSRAAPPDDPRKVRGSTTQATTTSAPRYRAGFLFLAKFGLNIKLELQVLRLGALLPSWPYAAFQRKLPICREPGAAPPHRLTSGPALCSAAHEHDLYATTV